MSNQVHITLHVPVRLHVVTDGDHVLDAIEASEVRRALIRFIKDADDKTLCEAACYDEDPIIEPIEEYDEGDPTDEAA